MKIIDCVQGSPEWLTARLGIPTASEFHKIITAVKGDLSKQARKYAHELVAETLLGRPLEAPLATFAMLRGQQLEPQAVQQYEFATDTETRAVGFITTDDGRLGCSPDRLVVGVRHAEGVLPARGGLEIKCQLDGNHIGTLIDGPGEDYKQQVQGTLAICEAEWWDLYAYHPELPPVTIRTYRDEPYISKMRAALGEFLDLRDAMLEQARASGFFEAAKAAA
jgi:hypothetical protein